MKYKCGECLEPCYLSSNDTPWENPVNCPHEGSAKWKEVPDDTPILGASGFPGTLRDWFAGQALVGWLASFAGMDHPIKPKYISTEVYKFADEMLAAREKKES